MSACLVYGCPARLPSHASAMCDARPRASVPPRSRLLRGLLRSPCACVLSCASLPLARHLPNPNDVSPDLQPADYEMQTNEVPTSAPGDCAPTSEEPAPIKMTNQQLDTPVHDGHCTLSYFF